MTSSMCWALIPPPSHVEMVPSPGSSGEDSMSPFTCPTVEGCWLAWMVIQCSSPPFSLLISFSPRPHPQPLSKFTFSSLPCYPIPKSNYLMQGGIKLMNLLPHLPWLWGLQACISVPSPSFPFVRKVELGMWLRSKGGVLLALPTFTHLFFLWLPF